MKKVRNEREQSKTRGLANQLEEKKKGRKLKHPLQEEAKSRPENAP